MKVLLMKALTMVLLVVACGIAKTQVTPRHKPPNTRILFIFDASQSMAGQWQSGRKISIARNLLIKMIDSLEYLDNVEMALRIYGHQSPVPPQDCSDTRLEVPFSKGNASRIRQELRFLNPKGTTPLAYSLQLSQQDFPTCDDCRNIVILITDGIEACEGDPCEVSLMMQRKGIILKPFIIGIGIDDNFKESFNCIGNFYNAKDEEKFEEVLGVVINQALNSTTAQVNLLNARGEPTETNVNMSFMDRTSGKVLYNYVHTINHRGVPDTLTLDHLITYRLKVNTLPPVFVDSIKLSVGNHSIIAVDAPQGSLVVDTKYGDYSYRDEKFVVRKAGEQQTLTVLKFGETEKFIVGSYDIEIFTIPRIHLKNVEIEQSTKTTIEVPRPGILTLIMASHGYGSLYQRGNEGEKWVYNLDTDSRKQSLLLQPGKYRVVFRAANVKQSIYTISKTFEIESGDSQVIQLY